MDEYIYIYIHFIKFCTIGVILLAATCMFTFETHLVLLIDMGRYRFSETIETYSHKMMV